MRFILVDGKLAQIDLVLGSGDQVQHLPKLGLVACLQRHSTARRFLHLMEELQHADIVRAPTKAAIEDLVDGRLDKERVVDGNVPNTFLLA